MSGSGTVGNMSKAKGILFKDTGSLYVNNSHTSDFLTTHYESIPTSYSDDEDTVPAEEGQEAMLVEELDPPETRNGDKDDKQSSQQQQANEPSRQKKYSKKKQQVLLVPSEGELILERHRLAAQRAAKARALLERAFDWETTIHNREQLTKDAFTEAGKARLLIEPRTLELQALLMDAKLKGEEEAFMAHDLKVTKLVPDVQLPDDSKLTSDTEAGMSRSTTIESVSDDGLTNTFRLTKTIPGGQLTCLQPAITNNTVTMGSSEDDDDETLAEDHVFRAKQYLEFILPGNGSRDDSSEFTSSNHHDVLEPDTLLEQYKELQREPEDLSSLGYDESHLLEQHHRETDADAFSMSSLNEILDGPLDLASIQEDDEDESSCESRSVLDNQQSEDVEKEQPRAESVQEEPAMVEKKEKDATKEGKGLLRFGGRWHHHSTDDENSTVLKDHSRGLFVRIRSTIGKVGSHGVGTSSVVQSKSASPNQAESTVAEGKPLPRESGKEDEGGLAHEKVASEGTSDTSKVPFSLMSSNSIASDKNDDRYEIDTVIKTPVIINEEESITEEHSRYSPLYSIKVGVPRSTKCLLDKVESRDDSTTCTEGTNQKDKRVSKSESEDGSIIAGLNPKSKGRHSLIGRLRRPTSTEESDKYSGSTSSLQNALRKHGKVSQNSSSQSHESKKLRSANKNISKKKQTAAGDAKRAKIRKPKQILEEKTSEKPTKKQHITKKAPQQSKKPKPDGGSSLKKALKTGKDNEEPTQVAVEEKQIQKPRSKPTGSKSSQSHRRTSSSDHNVVARKGKKQNKTRSTEISGIQPSNKPQGLRTMQQDAAQKKNGTTEARKTKTKPSKPSGENSKTANREKGANGRLKPPLSEQKKNKILLDKSPPVKSTGIVSHTPSWVSSIGLPIKKLVSSHSVTSESVSSSKKHQKEHGHGFLAVMRPFSRQNAAQQREISSEAFLGMPFPLGKARNPSIIVEGRVSEASCNESENVAPNALSSHGCTTVQGSGDSVVFVKCHNESRPTELCNEMYYTYNHHENGIDSIVNISVEDKETENKAPPHQIQGRTPTSLVETNNAPVPPHESCLQNAIFHHLPADQSPFFGNNNPGSFFRPDADGHNARARDVREVLGLAPLGSFSEQQRAQSFLSRITNATHRQDAELPDP